jgi:FMN-dependent NADH-azoreductase
VERRVERILAINSSVSGEGSVSRMLVEDAVRRLLEASPGSQVTHRDLGDAPVPHLTPLTVAGVRAEAATEHELAARALSDDLIAELRQATILVIGAPMYNFSIPSSLRSWFDHVLRPRVTFAYGESGPRGVIEGVRAIVVQSRGGLYSEGPSKVLDFQEPYLGQLLGFMGITDVAFVHAEKIGYGPEAREAAIEHAKAQIGGLVARIAAGETVAPAPHPTASPDDAIDYEAILGSNLERVFNERDPARRLEAISELYEEDAVLHEPDRSATGYAAIAKMVSEAVDMLPVGARFRSAGPAVGNRYLGRGKWRAGLPDGPAAVTGTDVVRVENGRIKALHVFIDKAEV